MRAINSYFELGYEIYYWRTKNKVEVDYVLYGKRGLVAIEVKSGASIRSDDLDSLDLFGQDYPMSKRIVVYGGVEQQHRSGVDIVPATKFLSDVLKFI